MSSDARRVEALDRARHEVRDFACGSPVLDRRLHAYAGQAQRRKRRADLCRRQRQRARRRLRHARRRQVEHAAAADIVRARLSPHVPIRVGLIARLAVTASYQGQGLGTDMVRDALRRIRACRHASRALVHAIDASAAAFYERLGFQPATPDGLTLMVPLAAVRAALLGP